MREQCGGYFAFPGLRAGLETGSETALQAAAEAQAEIARRQAVGTHHPSKRKPSAIGTDEDTVDLARRLTAHYPDAKIAWILNGQGRRHAWHGREIPLEPARWPLIADDAHSAPACRST